MSRVTPGALGTIALSGADGAIQDGADSSIEATVLDYSNSNPLAVRLTDTSGDYVATFAVTNAGTFAVQESGAALTALQLIDNAISGSGFNITQFNGEAIDVGAGTEAAALRVTLPTNGTGVIAGVTTVTTVSTVTAMGAGTTGPMKAEDVAHASGDQGFPAWGVRQDTPNATAAASNDYHYLATDMVGGIRTALYETDFAVLGTNHVKKYYTSAGAVTDGIVWSPAAGKRWYVTDIFIGVSAASTVTLEDDLSGGDSALWKMELSANSGWSHHFSTPLFSGEDAADLIITTSAGNVYVTVTGYEI